MGIAESLFIIVVGIPLIIVLTVFGFLVFFCLGWIFILVWLIAGPPPGDLISKLAMLSLGVYGITAAAVVFLPGLLSDENRLPPGLKFLAQFLPAPLRREGEATNEGAMTHDDNTDDDVPETKSVLPLRKPPALSLPATPHGWPTVLARMRAYANRKYFESREAEIRAHSGMISAFGENLRDQMKVRRDVIKFEQWDEERERKRIRDKQRIKDIDLDEQLENKEHERDMARLRREDERKQREQAPKTKRRRTSGPSDLERFREEMEQLMKTGTLGSYMAIAEEFRQRLIEERGGEEYLTEEDKRRIELAFELARRYQESKG